MKGKLRKEAKTTGTNTQSNKAKENVMNWRGSERMLEETEG